MEIEYSLTEEDILKLVRYRINHLSKNQNPFGKRRFILLSGFLLMGLGVYLINSDILLTMLFLILGILSYFFYPTFFDLAIKRKVKVTYRDEKKRETIATRMLYATSEGIEEKSSLGEVKKMGCN